MPDILRWTLFAISTLVSCVVSVLIIYFGFRFHQYRHHQALQKRYPPLVYFACFLSVLYFFGSRTFYDLAFIYDYTVHAYYIWGTVFYVLSIHGEVLVIIARVWIVYFNIKFTEQMQHQKWNVYIDPTQASIDSFWFIKHKKDLGSYRFVVVCVFIYYLLEAALLLILGVSFAPFPIIFNAIDSILFIMEVIVALAIWFKIPNFYDIFGMKIELKYMLYCGGISLGVYIFYFFINWLIDNIWLFFINWTVGSLGIAIATMIFSSYIYLSKYKYLLSEDMLMLTNNVNDKPNIFKLCDTLKHDELIGEFLMHLTEEFSIELLLSYIEFRQFKNLMANDEEFMKQVTQTKSNDNYIVSPKVPKSHIVFTKHKDITSNIDRYDAIAKDLFDKYISYTAELTVNLSYSERQSVESAIHQNKLSNNELYTLFDRCSDTVCLLMWYSHQRFVQSDRYTVYQRESSTK